MKISQLVKSDLPREKASLYGIESLSNRELLALILRSGSKNKNVLQLADDVLASVSSLADLRNISLNSLMKIDGIKQAKALELLAVFEISKRIAFDEVLHKKSIQKAMDLVEWLKLEIGHCMQENFLVIFLNQNNEIITYKTLFKGTLNASLVHPREIFKEAINIGCARIMCAHNHPSGKNEPSQADLDITTTLVECGKMMGIPLLDHIIISKSGYLSFKERMIID